MRPTRPAPRPAALALAVTLAAAISCGGSEHGEPLAPTPAPAPPPVPGPAARVVLTPDGAANGYRVALDQGRTLELTAKAVDSAGNVVKGVTFRFVIGAGDESTATISQTGPQSAVLTPTGPAGEALVLAISDPASGGLIGGTTVVVRQVAARLTVLPASVRLLPGGGRQITAALLDLAGDTVRGPRIAFGVRDGAVAWASDAGVVHAAAAEGATTLTVSSGSFSVAVPVEIVRPGHPAGRLAARVSLDTKYAFQADVTNEGVADVTLGTSGAIYRVDLASASFSRYFPDRRYNDLRGVVRTADAREAFVAASYHGLVPIDDALRLGPDGWPTQSYEASGYDNAPVSIALSADQRTLFVGTSRGTVYAVDVASGRRRFLAGVGGEVVSLALHPTRPVLYASTTEGVAEIDARDGAFHQLDLGGTINDRVVTQGIALSPDGRELYITHAHGLRTSVFVWDTDRAAASDSIAIPTFGLGLVVTPDGSQIYVGSETLYPGVVWVIDRARREIIETIAVGGVVGRLAISPDGYTIAAPNAGGWVDFIR